MTVTLIPEVADLAKADLDMAAEISALALDAARGDREAQRALVDLSHLCKAELQRSGTRKSVPARRYAPTADRLTELRGLAKAEIARHHARTDPKETPDVAATAPRSEKENAMPAEAQLVKVAKAAMKEVACVGESPSSTEALDMLAAVAVNASDGDAVDRLAKAMLAVKEAAGAATDPVEKRRLKKADAMLEDQYLAEISPNAYRRRERDLGR